MTTTIEMLEQRVAALEKEVAELKRASLPRQTPADYWERLAERSPLIREMLDNSVLTAEEIATYRKALGIEHVQPIGAEKLQELLIAEGHDPTSNETSRMLIEMREE